MSNPFDSFSFDSIHFGLTALIKQWFIFLPASLYCYTAFKLCDLILKEQTKRAWRNWQNVPNKILFSRQDSPDKVLVEWVQLEIILWTFIVCVSSFSRRVRRARIVRRNGVTREIVASFIACFWLIHLISIILGCLGPFHFHLSEHTLAS